MFVIFCSYIWYCLCVCARISGIVNAKLFPNYIPNTVHYGRCDEIDDNNSDNIDDNKSDKIDDVNSDNIDDDN